MYYPRNPWFKSWVVHRVTSAQAPSKIGANNNSWANSGGLLYTIGAGYNTRNQVDGYSFTEQYYNWAISNNQLNYQPYLKYVKNLSIDGYTDYYIPSRNELKIIYYNLKPTY